MKIFIKLSIIFISAYGMVSCTPKMTRDLWNGVYSQRAAVKEYDKKEKAYYDKESLEQKELRKKNRKICLNESRGNKDSKQKWNEDIFLKCMKTRGTPIY